MHALSVLLLTPALVWAAGPLKLTSKYEGSDFFHDWFFDSNAVQDRMSTVQYLSDYDAQRAGLYTINTAGHAVLRTDNTTDVPGIFGRNSVRAHTIDAFSVSTLVVLDASHVPYGCSVGPTFRTEHRSPAGGGINIISGVNMMQANQYSLRQANPGCTLAANMSLPYSGAQTAVRCDNNTYDTVITASGCWQGIQETASTSSLGAAFAKNGGGVYAMYWSAAGVQAWFFEERPLPRAAIPTDLKSESPEPSTWPPPSAAYYAGGCDFTQYIGVEQHLVLDIDICGSWAGDAAVFNQTGCVGLCSAAVGNPRNFDRAYWEIGYIKLFTETGYFKFPEPSTSSSADAAGATGIVGKTSGVCKGIVTSLKMGAALLAGVVALLA